MIEKLLLDPELVGEERDMAKARLIDKFWEEHEHFVNRSGCKLWTEEDFDELGLDKFDFNVARLKASPPTKPKKLIRAWNYR